MVHDLELDAELGVLVLQRVEAVRAGGDDLLDLGLLEHLGVLHRELLEDELVAGAAGRVAGAGLAVAEHRERDAGQESGSLLGSGEQSQQIEIQPVQQRFATRFRGRSEVFLCEPRQHKRIDRRCQLLGMIDLR